jgi:uncharacterized protein (TIGR03435 family)
MAGIGDRVVVDKTGLDGSYDFTLTFVRDATPPPDLKEPLALADGPPISVALREQLGLRLEEKRAPVGFLVVTHVEKPSEN